MITTGPKGPLEMSEQLDEVEGKTSTHGSAHRKLDLEIKSSKKWANFFDYNHLSTKEMRLNHIVLVMKNGEKIMSSKRGNDKASEE